MNWKEFNWCQIDKKELEKNKRLTYRIRRKNGIVCKSKISTKYMIISIYLIPLLYHTFYLKPIPKWKVLKVFSNRPLAEMLVKDKPTEAECNCGFGIRYKMQHKVVRF